jgi:Restriction endonuclease
LRDCAHHRTLPNRLRRIRASAPKGGETWETYEEVARYLLDKICDRFGLERVEGKQKVLGDSTDWRIDAKGVRQGGVGFLIVECRRYTTSKLAQEDVGGLAFRISDTGADGGIIVSPFDLQKGAKKVANAKNIKHVTLDPNSATTEYVMRFLGDIFAGLHDTSTATDGWTAIVHDKDGNDITRR